MMALSAAVAWIAATIAALVVLLLVVPWRLRAIGRIDDHDGADYELYCDWALGVIAVGKAAGRPFRVKVLGLPVLCLSPGKKRKTGRDKQTHREKRSRRASAGWIKRHYRTLGMIIDRMAQAAFLGGYLRGRIGLVDPDQTAWVGLLSRMAPLPSGRFALDLTAVYEEACIQLDAGVRATLILGALAGAAVSLLFRRQTRVMLRQLRHA